MIYTPVRISTLRPNKQIPFGLFIYFQEKYLEYIKSGGSFDDEKYNKLKKQKISKFYIDAENESKYQKYLDELLTIALSDDNVDLDTKVDMVEGSAQTAINRMQDDPGSEVSYNLTKVAAKGLSKVILDNPEALRKIFDHKGDESELLIKHSLNVAALSIKLAKASECNEEEIENVATAGLMHDVGITLLPAEQQTLFKKNKKELSSEETVAFWEHCKGSLKILRDKDYINPDILSLVENHEELLSGKGPNKKTELTKLEEILSMVNAYDKRVTILGMDSKDAIKDLMMTELGNYNLTMIQTFQKVIKDEF